MSKFELKQKRVQGSGETRPMNTDRVTTRPPYYEKGLLAQQQTLGNQTVQQLLGLGTIQAQHLISQPDDKFEQEADHVAKQLMQMQGSELNESTMKAKRRIMQRKEAPGDVPGVSQNLESRINSIMARGNPLPDSVRAFFEPRFGCDLSDVRIHTDVYANDLAKGLRAKAFTVGRHIFVPTKEYLPYSPQGKELLAHELVHVLQGKISGTATTNIGPELIDRSPQKGEAERSKESIEERARRIHSEWKERGWELKVEEIEKEIREAERIKEEEEIQEKQWLKFQIGLQRDFQLVMRDHVWAADKGTRRAVETIFNGIDELAELEVLKWQTIFSGVRMIPAIRGLPIGGHIGKQIDTTIQVMIGMEKKMTIKKLKSELTTRIEEDVFSKLLDPYGKEYTDLMTAALLDAKLHWLANLMYLHKGEYEIDDPRYAMELKAYLSNKYGASSDDIDKWKDAFVHTYGPKFYLIFKEKGLL